MIIEIASISCFQKIVQKIEIGFLLPIVLKNRSPSTSTTISSIDTGSLQKLHGAHKSLCSPSLPPPPSVLPPNPRPYFLLPRIYVYVLFYVNVNEQPVPGEVVSPKTAAVLVARGEALEELGMEATTTRQVRCPVGSSSVRFCIVRFQSVLLGFVGFLFLSVGFDFCLLYTSPSPRDRQKSRMPSSA